MTAQVVVIGMGSSIRGDDALGQMIATELEQEFSGVDQVQVELTHTLTPELASVISSAEFVLFVDASKEGEPGTIHEQKIEAASGTDLAMVHFLDPPALLTWAKVMYEAKPEAVMISIVGEDFGFRENELSPLLQSHFNDVLSRCEGHVKKNLLN